MSEKVKSTSKIDEAKRKNSISQTRRTDLSQSQGTAIDQILFLQRTIGNQAVGNLLKSGAIQAKLRIGQPNDKYEQEADRVAEQVMRMPEPRVQGQSKVKERVLRTEEQSSRMPEVTPELESHIRSMKGGGQPLPKSVRGFFELRFGRGFSHVRAHTDAQAAELAQVMKARAFTVGRDVVFGAGQYAPGTATGKRLLAHELTHVVQEKRTSTGVWQKLTINQDNRLEKETDGIGNAVAERRQSEGAFWDGNVSPTVVHRVPSDIRLARVVPKEVRRLRDLDDYNDAEITDDLIRQTNEYKAYTNPSLVWQAEFRLTSEEALLACRFMLREMRFRSINWEKEARWFAMIASSRKYSCYHSVQLIPQLTNMSCWAAAAAMLVGWRDRMSIDPEDMARGAGRYAAYKTGLAAKDFPALASAFGLTLEPPMSYTIETLYQMLKDYGPLWIGAARPRPHVIVVTGMAGDRTADGTEVMIYDPQPVNTGSIYRESFATFIAAYEAAAVPAGFLATIMHN